MPSVQDEGVQVLCRESNVVYRKILEAMYIKYNDPSLNRNVGKADIPSVYDKVLREEEGLAIPDIRE